MRLRYCRTILIIAVAAGCGNSQPPSGASIAPEEASRGAVAAEPACRPPEWAVPVEKAGLPNFHKVSDTFYRGAQPTEEGFKELAAMGIKAVINLRSFHSDRDEIQETPFVYEHILMKAWHAEDEDIVRFLKIVTDPEKTPVFVHCQHGADRTGTMTAIYRIAVEGWTKEAAMDEMTKGGFGFHGVWDNLLKYIRDLDIEAIKKAAGIGHD